ncbi:MAG: CheR family methyltransferase [Pseudomonadota bacterium]
MTVESEEAVQESDIPLIAIGASAGGLEPLEAFFRTAPAEAGWCYVVLQHLSPDRRSMMDEILSRCTSLSIKHVSEGAKILPDTIYLNVPNTLVELDGDTFTLTPFNDTDTLPHLPIDAFFYSVAARGAQVSAAVVLSGSGSDGASGATEVRRAGGRVFVQLPVEAGFDSMPRSVMSAGVADHILPASEIPGVIADWLNEPCERATDNAPSDAPPGEKILRQLELKHRVDFSAYKRPTVFRRIERRHQLRGLETIAEYQDLVAKDPEALEELYHDLLIGVTEFYRDPDAFSSLRRNVLSVLVNRMHTDLREIRIWVLACAGGEEAYSLAIELSEAFRVAGVQPNFRIIATDVHRPSIERAAAGIYSEVALAKVPPDLRERYFVEHRLGYIVDPVLRQRVIFSVHEALRDPPFMQLDLVSCRNLLIYLNESAQDRIVSKFIFGLLKGGFLFLGPSETLRRTIDDFAPVDKKWRIYRKVTDRRVMERSILMEAFQMPDIRSRRVSRMDLPARPPLTLVEQSQTPRQDRASLLRGYDALLRRYAPSSILITSDGHVMTWFGTAGAYVDTMSDLAERTVEEIVHPDVRYTINIGIERLSGETKTSFSRHVRVDGESEGQHTLLVTMETLGGTVNGQRLILVTLQRDEKGDEREPDGSAAHEGAVSEDGDAALLIRRVRQLERDLRLTEESLQYVTERLEASGEELQASNEELQASNEELQASNEELQASNEELHAVNEELVSVSAEHERKIELLSDLNHDTELVFESLEIGLLILDEGLRIRRFTGLCGEAYELEPQDTGRLIGNVGARPDFVDTAALARQALETGVEQTADGPYRDGQLGIRAIPFQSGSRLKRGVMLLFTGTTIRAAAAARKARR